MRAHPGKSAEYRHRARVKDPCGPLAVAIRARCKERGIVCTITAAHLRPLFASATHCPVLGVPLNQRVNGVYVGHPAYHPTVDRLRPREGYVPGNIAILSARANRLKDDATLEEMERMVAWLKATMP